MAFTLITTQPSKIEKRDSSNSHCGGSFTNDMIGELQLNFYFLKRQVGFFFFFFFFFFIGKVGMR